ncbi:MAG: hypothetical protein ACK5QT_03625 [Oligoflexia bacterium]
MAIFGYFRASLAEIIHSPSVTAIFLSGDDAKSENRQNSEENQNEEIRVFTELRERHPLPEIPRRYSSCAYAGQPLVDSYFNHRDYKRPAGDLGSCWFWSGSGHPDYPTPDRPRNAYNLSGLNGVIFDDAPSFYKIAVRCVQSD